MNEVNIHTETAQVLDEAGEYLRRDGWCQREMHNAYGQRCLLGGLNAAITARVWPTGVDYDVTDAASAQQRQERAGDLHRRASRAVIGVLGLSPQAGDTEGGKAIAVWNDEPWRTVPEVLDALAAAARVERHKALCLEAATILQDAAEVVEKRGWVQYEFATPEGQVCSLGALRTAMLEQREGHPVVSAWLISGGGFDGQPAYAEAHRALLEVIEREHPGHWYSVPHWNNSFGRTAQQVIDAMQLAAKAELMLAEAGP